MSRILWVIAEDEHDVAILRQIFAKLKISVTVRAYPRGQTPGIGGLSRNLAKWLADIRNGPHWKQGDCIAVLHDQDSTVPEHQPLKKQIEAICQRENLVRLVANDKIEAWLLADGGLCNFLGIKPQYWDGRPDAKRELETRLRPKKMTYQSRDRERLIEKLDGSAVKLSPSLKQSIEALQAADCLSGEAL